MMRWFIFILISNYRFKKIFWIKQNVNLLCHLNLNIAFVVKKRTFYLIISIKDDNIYDIFIIKSISTMNVYKILFIVVLLAILDESG